MRPWPLQQHQPRQKDQGRQEEQLFRETVILDLHLGDFDGRLAVKVVFIPETFEEGRAGEGLFHDQLPVIFQNRKPLRRKRRGCIATDRG